MAWTLEGIRIFVQTNDETTSQTIARLQPLSGATKKQYFGWEEEIKKLTAYIVGNTDFLAIKGMAQSSGIPYTLMYDSTTIGEYVVHSASISEKMGICQTLRPDLDSTASVYLVELELYPA